MIASLWLTINNLADQWATYMATALIDTTIGLALVVCIYLAVRHHVSPRWCYLLFLLVPMKLLLPVSLPLIPSFATAIDAETVYLDPPTTELTPALPYPAAPPLDLAARPSPANATDQERSAALSTRDGTLVSPSIATMLMLLWAAIVFWLGCRFVRNQFLLMRLLAGASSFSPATYGVDFDVLRSRLGIRRQIPVLTSRQINVPAVAGLVHPRIILPTALLDTLDTRQLECILAHELAHLKWHDVPVALLERLVRIVHFVNPAIWMATHLAHIHRENACDDASLNATDMDRRSCGATLLLVLEFAHSQQHGPFLLSRSSKERVFINGD